MSEALGWLVLLAMFAGALWLGTKVVDKLERRTVSRERYRDRWGHPLNWKQSPQEREELELLESLWRKSPNKIKEGTSND